MIQQQFYLYPSTYLIYSNSFISKILIIILLLVFDTQSLSQMHKQKGDKRQKGYIVYQKSERETEGKEESQSVYWIFLIDTLIQSQSKEISSLYTRKISKHQPIVTNIDNLKKTLKKIQQIDSQSIIRIVTNKYFFDKIYFLSSAKDSQLAKLLSNLQSLYLYIPNLEINKLIKKEQFIKLRQRIPNWKSSPIIIYDVKQAIRQFMEQMRKIKGQPESIFQNCYSLGDKSSTQKIQRYRSRLYFCIHLKVDQQDEILQYKQLFRKQISSAKYKISSISLLKNNLITQISKIFDKKIANDNSYCKQILQLYGQQSPQFYYIINSGLRQFGEQHFQWQNFVIPIFLLFHAIKFQKDENSNPQNIQKKITLYRGGVLQEEQFLKKLQSLRKAQFYQFTTFISTSQDQKIAVKFLKKTIGLKNACLFKFQIKPYQLLKKHQFNLPFSGIYYTKIMNKNNQEDEKQIVLNLLTVGRITNCRQVHISQFKGQLADEYQSYSNLISTFYQITIQVGHFEELLDHYFQNSKKLQKEQTQCLRKTQILLNKTGLSLSQTFQFNMSQDKELSRTTVGNKFKSSQNYLNLKDYKPQDIMKMSKSISYEYYKSSIIEYLQMMEIFKQIVDYNIQDAYLLSREYGKAVRSIDDKISKIKQLKQSSHQYSLLTKLSFKKSNIFRKQGFLTDSLKSFNTTMQLNQKFKEYSKIQKRQLDNNKLAQINNRIKNQYLDFLMENNYYQFVISKLLKKIEKLKEEMEKVVEKKYKNRYQISLIYYDIGLYYSRVLNDKSAEQYFENYTQQTLKLNDDLSNQIKAIYDEKIEMKSYVEYLINRFFNPNIIFDASTFFYQKNERERKLKQLLFFLQDENGFINFFLKCQQIERNANSPIEQIEKDIKQVSTDMIKLQTDIKTIIQNAKADQSILFTQDSQGNKKKRDDKQIKVICEELVSKNKNIQEARQKLQAASGQKMLKDIKQESEKYLAHLLTNFKKSISKQQKKSISKQQNTSTSKQQNNNKDIIVGILEQQGQMKSSILQICEMMLKNIPKQTMHYNYYQQKKKMFQIFLAKQQQNRENILPKMNQENQQTINQYLKQNQRILESYVSQLRKQGFSDTSNKIFSYIMNIIDISIALKNIAQINQAQNKLKEVYQSNQQFKTDHQNYHNCNISFTKLYESKISQIRSQCIFPNIHQKSVHLQSFYYKPSKSFDKTVALFFQTKMQSISISFNSLKQCQKHLQLYRENIENKILLYLKGCQQSQKDQLNEQDVDENTINIEFYDMNQISKSMNEINLQLKEQGWKTQQFKLITFLKMQSSQSKFKMNKFIDIIYLTPIRIKLDIIELKMSGILPPPGSSRQFNKFYQLDTKQALIQIEEKIKQGKRIIGYFKSSIFIKERSSLKQSLAFLRLLQGKRTQSIDSINKVLSIRYSKLPQGEFRLNQQNGQTLSRSVLLLKGQNETIPLVWIKKIEDYYNFYHNHRLYWMICLSFFVSYCQQTSLQKQFKSLQCLNSSMATLQRNNFYQDNILYKIYDFQLYEKLYLPYIAKIKKIKDDKKLQQRERKTFIQPKQ